MMMLTKKGALTCATQVSPNPRVVAATDCQFPSGAAGDRKPALGRPVVWSRFGVPAVLIRFGSSADRGCRRRSRHRRHHLEQRR